jgi:hypothetical protein
MKKLITIISLLSLLMFQYVVNASTFSDSEGHWADSSITRLTSSGIINGYPDGTFKPENKITRGEFIKILVKSLGFELLSGGVFSDMKGHWAESYVETAASNGIIIPLEIGPNFSPDSNITRIDMVTMMVRALKLDPLNVKSPFVDTVTSYGYANVAFEEYLVRGYINAKGEREFHVDGQTTRAEASTIITRMLDYTADPVKFKEDMKAKENSSVPTPTPSVTPKPSQTPVPKIITQEIVDRLSSYTVKDFSNTGNMKDAHTNFSEMNMDAFKYDKSSEIVKLASDYISVEFTKDYRKMQEDYKKNLLFFLRTKFEFKDKVYLPIDYVNAKITDAKSNHIVMISEFITNESMVYLNKRGSNTIRGELHFKYVSNDSLPEGIKLDQWYKQDVELLFGIPVTNVQITWDTSYYSFFDLVFLNAPTILK